MTVGIVFEMVQPRMAAMWHCHFVDGYIDSVFEDVAKKHSGSRQTTSTPLTARHIQIRLGGADAEIDWQSMLT